MSGEANSFEGAEGALDSNSQQVDDGMQFSKFSTGDEDRPACVSQEVDIDAKVGEWKRDQNPLFLELCSGCGILSATVAASGFDTMAVDHKHNRHRVHVKTFNLDLTLEHSWKVLKFIVQKCNVAAVHIAPPCGTCSRAREIRLTSDWHGPPPLRNADYPYGVPDMSDKDRLRVQQANQLYMFMSDFCLFLNERSVPWTVENPTNSWLWELPCMRSLMIDMYFTSFHSCAYGGKRYKGTSFLTNHPAFLVLCRQCDGMHEHLPWGFDEQSQQFSTALEAEYPRPLCQEYTRILLDMAASNGIEVTPFPRASEKLHPHKQHAGRAVPPLVPEYDKVVSMLLPTSPKLDGKNKLLQALPNIPKGSKLLRSEVKGGQGDKQFTMYVFGIFHGHEKFVKVARSLWHPFDELRHLPDFLTRAIYNVLHNSKVEIARQRLETLQLWRRWADELADDERDLKGDMPAHVKKVMECKRLCLLNKLACEVLEWPDKNLMRELASGFRLVGEAPATGVFRVQPKPGHISEDELMAQSKFLRPAIIGKANNAASSQHESELYDITLKEASCEFLLRNSLLFAHATI